MEWDPGHVGKEQPFLSTSYMSGTAPHSSIYEILRHVHLFNSTNSYRATAFLHGQVEGKSDFFFFFPKSSFKKRMNELTLKFQMSPLLFKGSSHLLYFQQQSTVWGKDISLK